MKGGRADSIRPGNEILSEHATHKNANNRVPFFFLRHAETGISNPTSKVSSMPMPDVLLLDDRPQLADVLYILGRYTELGRYFVPVHRVNLGHP